MGRLAPAGPGRWPEGVAVVIIALLPKPDGGHRPIGLFPLLVRVWARLRKTAAQSWEKDHERTFFYAGAAKGANVAAWKLAARAEGAAANRAAYAASLLDMVKAFERVPHDKLVHYAVIHGYQLWVLRLSLAAYRLVRVVGINGVFSAGIVASRGITAGSTMATVELRILLLDLLDRTARRFVYVALTCYVDDVFIDAAATERLVDKHVTAATDFCYPWHC